MFPFHRHHNNSSSSSNSHKLKGTGRSRDRGHREDEDEEDSCYQSDNSRFSKAQSHSELQQSRWDYVLGETNAAPRVRDHVAQYPTTTHHSRTNVDKYSDNKFRLGTNRLTNVFSSLQNLKVETLVENPPSILSHRSANALETRPASREGKESQWRLKGETVTELKIIPKASKSSSSEAEVDIIDNSIELKVDGITSEEINNSLKKDSPGRVTVELNKWAVDVKDVKSVINEDRDLSGQDVGLIVVEELDDEDKDKKEGTVLDKESGEQREENVLGIVIKNEGEVCEELIEDKIEKNEKDNIAEVDDQEVKEDEGRKKDTKEMGPVKDEDVNQDKAIGVKPINEQTAIALKEVVLGSAKALFSSQWIEQGFTLDTNHRIRYGFVQNKGGPCGVLATVQAALLRILLFEVNTCSCTQPLRPTGSEARTALIAALSEVLWRAAADDQRPSLVVSSGDSVLRNNSIYRCDGLTETLSVATFHSRASLQDGVRDHLDQFIKPGSGGCLLMVMSIVLSRGIARVKSDMDESTPLIGSKGRCSLELVNLLLIGRAVSNVFDNNIKSGTCVIKGVHGRSEIGFLTLFEHYNAVQVGSYLKTPRHPIWLVFYDDHYTVLFSHRKELISDWRAEKRFVLYHYDSLARQKDEVQLTIDTTGLYLKAREDGHIIPPLELCIRTKWKGALVHWNDSTTKP